MNKLSSLEFLDRLGLAKMSLKLRTLLHVERTGPMTFTEIQRYMVDLKFGEGAYDRYRMSGFTSPYRGWYCSYFSGSWRGPGLFMRGPFRLEKQSDGLYRAVRD